MIHYGVTLFALCSLEVITIQYGVTLFTHVNDLRN
jgi:hypothetical protein